MKTIAKYSTRSSGNFQIPLYVCDLSNNYQHLLTNAYLQQRDDFLQSGSGPHLLPAGTPTSPMKQSNVNN